MNILFPYYGAKFQWARKYAAPEHSSIREPFCGAAGYSLYYNADHVYLNDVNPVIASVWEYLISSSENEIRSLPEVKTGDDVRDFSIPQEAKWLIGFWLNPGSTAPKNKPSTFSKYAPGDPRYRRTRTWTPFIRDRIATQKSAISHWKITCNNYADLPNIPATWFIDPPYQNSAGRYYANDSVDYPDLENWVKSRYGQQIACGSGEDNWLPFTPLLESETSSGNKAAAKRTYKECVYYGQA